MYKHAQKYTAQVHGSSDRSFGFFFAAVFLIIALYPLVGSQAVRSWALTIGAAILIVALFAPKVLTPANRLWMKFGLLLHHIVTPIALCILFFLVVTPTGLLMRLLGKDPLRLRFDPTADSYWIKRRPPGPDADSFNNQF